MLRKKQKTQKITISIKESKKSSSQDNTEYDSTDDSACYEKPRKVIKKILQKKIMMIALYVT